MHKGLSLRYSAKYNCFVNKCVFLCHLDSCTGLLYRIEGDKAIKVYCILYNTVMNVIQCLSRCRPIALQRDMQRRHLVYCHRVKARSHIPTRLSLLLQSRWSETDLLHLNCRRVSLTTTRLLCTDQSDFTSFFFVKQDRKGWGIPGIFGDYLRFSLI